MMTDRNTREDEMDELPVTIVEADSLGSVQEDVASVIERWVVGGLDEELVSLTTIVEAFRTLDGPATRSRVLRWINARYAREASERPADV